MGWGAYFRGQWSQGHWNPEFLSRHQPSTSWLELYALVVGIWMWKDQLVAMVNKQMTSSRKSMALVRLLVYAQLKYDFRVKAEYIRSEDNNVADALSCF